MVYFKLQNKTKQEAEWAAIIQMIILVDIWLDHIHNDIITCNTEEPQQKYRLEIVSHRVQDMGGGFNMFYWIQTVALFFFCDLKI